MQPTSQPRRRRCKRKWRVEERKVGHKKDFQIILLVYLPARKWPLLHRQHYQYHQQHQLNRAKTSHYTAAASTTSTRTKIKRLKSKQSLWMRPRVLDYLIGAVYHVWLVVLAALSPSLLSCVYFFCSLISP